MKGRHHQRHKTILLAILDGWGVAPPSPANAITQAATPHMDRWSRDYPATTLIAHDGMVGLPEGQMGNSEVGHLNIGAGRIVYQDFTRINLALQDGSLRTNPVLTGLMDRLGASGGRLHLLGLLSDGGVHSHIDHLIGLLEMAAERQVAARVHCFMDGRDTPPTSGINYMEQLVAALERIGSGRVATVIGRYWAMDRDKRWDRVELAWKAMVGGQGETAPEPVAAVQAAYERGETDEFIKPTVIVDGGVPVGSIADGDGVFFFNFRADRARELCHALSDARFSHFDVSDRPRLLELATMTQYETTFSFPVAFPPVTLTHILGEEISAQGMCQLRIAETEKYAHVTYFFNGGREEPFPGEERILIDSPRDVATYDQKPAMSAPEVTDQLLAELARAEEVGKPFSLVVLNFANGDMVGHTGILEAAIQACETVDQCLGRIREFLRHREAILLVTADHGNAELMRDPETGAPHTAHTTNPVPFIMVADDWRKVRLRPGGALRDIAPTILALLDMPQPEAMTGMSLLGEDLGADRARGKQDRQ